MTTRSSIGIKTQDGKYKAIYCHWDGYIEGVGETLRNFYNTPEKVEELLALGDISALADNPDDTIAHHRDFGEKLYKARVFDTPGEMVMYFSNAWCEYFYLFENGEWLVRDEHNDDFRIY